MSNCINSTTSSTLQHCMMASCMTAPSTTLWSRPIMMVQQHMLICNQTNKLQQMSVHMTYIVQPCSLPKWTSATMASCKKNWKTHSLGETKTTLRTWSKHLSCSMSTRAGSHGLQCQIPKPLPLHRKRRAEQAMVDQPMMINRKLPCAITVTRRAT